MSSKAIFLLNAAKRNGINIVLKEGALQLKLSKAITNSSAIDPALLQDIKDNKEIIIEFLNNDKLKSTRISASENAFQQFDRTFIQHISLSFSQERLWFIHQMEGSIQYHLPAIFRLKGGLNFEALQHALLTVVERHESLRSVIYEHNEEVYQKIMPATGWQLSVADAAVYKNDRRGLLNVIRPLISQPFDLSNDYMLRATLINVDLEEHVLVVTMHHIASDGWSLPVIVKEVVELYSAFIEGRASKLKALEVQYADYAVWQRNYLQGSILDQKIGYWKDQLTGVEPLQLPTDFARPSVQSTKGTSVGFAINQQQSQAIQQLSQQQGTTLFMTLLAAFKVLLHRYSGQQDICVGTPIAGRQQEEVEGLIGFFVNTLALRTQVNESADFTTLLAEVKSTTMDAYEHQEAPFEKVVEAVVKERDLGRSPLFQVMFVLQNTPDAPELALPGLTLWGESLENHTSKFDLSFYITETSNGLQCSVEYCTDLFRAETISRLICHYKNLLRAIVQSPQQKIGLLPMLSAEEQRDIITKVTGPTTIAGSQKTLADLFEAQASATPQLIALVFEKDTLSYQQLNDRSNQFSNYLRSKNVQPGDLVPICMDRGLELVTGILGILKCGATYVPVDVAYLEERINYVLEDINASILVTNKAFAGSFSTNTNTSIKATLVCVDEEIAGSYPSGNPAIKIDENIPACIIYTSGSTGRPKGVLLSHAGIINRLEWMYKTYPFEPNEKNAIKTSIGFVDHIWELFGALCAGIPSVIFPQQTLLDLDLLINELTKQQITRWVLVPSLLKTLLNKLQEDGSHLPQLKYWTSSGETLSHDLVKDFYQHFPASHHRLLNIYGSSEVTADVSCYDTGLSFNQSTESQLQQVPIGKPIFNTTLYLLDQQQHLVAQGIAGEIYVGGIQVAQGYLNLPELTAERFIHDPFSQQPGAKLFRTGDYGRLLEDGNIVYLGRIDDQVKIRGNRVELGEIEMVLRQQEQLKDCVVIAKTDADGNNNLIGYMVAESAIDQRALSTILRDRLPEYMVPASWVQLETLPLTASGKIDKKALPAADASARLTKVYTAPTSAMEEQLSKIWQQLLKREQVGIHDNFFELGGHSLLAMRVVSHIRKELSAELSIKDLFLHSTIATLAEHIRHDTSHAALPAIEVLPRPEYIPLSFSQERLWFIDRLEGTIQYHLPVVLRMKGMLNVELLSHSIQQLLERHEVLRTVILEADGQAYQQAIDVKDWQLTITDLSSLEQEEQQATVRQMIVAPFDLARDFMLRAGLLVINELEHVLVVTVHHISSDGWSMSVIVKEVMELYSTSEEDRSADLKPLAIQYGDYAVWQRNYLQGAELDKKINYWKQKLSGISPLQLPLDFVRPAFKTNAGARVGFQIEKDLLDKLQLLSKQEDATLFMTLLSAFNVLLQRHSGQEDICVGTPTANRPMQEVEELIGFFVNTLALRTEVNEADSFVTLLQQVKVTTMEAYDHQDTPFEKVVDAVVKERDMARTPVFQVMFVLQNTPEIPQFRLGELLLSRDRYDSNVSKFDLTLTVTETPNGLIGAFDYSTVLFKEQTMLTMINHFKQLLLSIEQAPGEAIGRLQLLSQQEEQELLVVFNNAAVDYPKNKTIIQLFEKQAAEHPASVALVFQNEVLTFGELNHRANQLANYLQQQGVKNESLVPLCFNRNADMIVALLGILKAGGAYVPIDPGYPADRIAFMLEDTGAKLLISNKESSDQLRLPGNIQLVKIDSDWPEIEQQSADNVGNEIAPNQLAYVIYTSGSTGKPKGVMIEHQALLDHCFGVIQAGDLVSCKSFALFAPLVFDAGHSIIHAAFILGAALHVISKNLITDGEKLADYITQHAVDCVKIVPSLWLSYTDTNHYVLAKRVMIFGGDSFTLSVLDRLVKMKYQGRVYNHYGPTEATIGKTIHAVDLKKQYINIPIGKPFSNTSLFILNKQLQLVPAGVPGELYIAGEGLARGYLNNPVLTAEKFINNPYSYNGASKMYKTGDQARWLPDGNIEYLGRIDEQVKIRGFRIEPGEIEMLLNESSLVQQAVVLAKETGNGNKVLVAYIVPHGNFDKAAMVAYLKDKLPEYMIPALWVPLQQIPLTSNGKIDRKALPVPDIHLIATNQYVAPQTALEQVLANTWQELLGVEKVGMYDNFFELGGDSIITIQVVSRARHKGYGFQVADIFTHQTISKLAALITKRSKDIKQTTGEQGILTGESGLLPIQQRYFSKKHAVIDHFNQAVLFQIDKAIEAPVLQHAIVQLSRHHDVLRLKFYMQDDEWHQAYGDKKAQLVVEDLSTTDNDNLSALITKHAAGYQRSLEIQQGDLFRPVLLKTPVTATHNRLLIVIHHLAVDGVSWRILLEDLEFLLTRIKQGEIASLGDKTDSYRQWYQALQQYGQSIPLLSQLAYWQNAVHSYYPLPVDTDYQGSIRAKDRGFYIGRLNANHTRHLIQDTSRLYHTEINDILLAALYVTLRDWTGQQKITIGLEGHGRQDIDSSVDTSRTAGWFSNHYPLLLATNTGRDSSGDCIKSVKEILRKVPDKGIGYGVLRYINKESTLQGTEPWDIVFNYLGQLDNVLKQGNWLKAAGESAGQTVNEDYQVSEKLAVNSLIQGGELQLNWSFSKMHYREETVATLANAYIANLEKIISFCTNTNPAEINYTPSDFELGAVMSYEELDHFLDEPVHNQSRREIFDGLYRLSPLQQGVLFHGLFQSGTATYVQQFACDLVGTDITIFTNSWNAVIKRHSILRSAFYHDVFSEPLQCVYKTVSLPVALLDYRNMQEQVKAAAVNAFENSNRNQAFDYKTAPLMRLTLIRLADDRYRMVWAWSHILFDGWSMQVLMEEFLSTYELLLSGAEKTKEAEDRYEDYIRYIRQNDKKQAEHYWRNYLQDVEESSLLPFIGATKERTKGSGSYKSEVLQLDTAVTARLQLYAQVNHITLNTIMQGIWSCLLHQYTGNDQVLYGVIVSGRPDDLPNVEKRVGLYINAAPLRASFSEDVFVTDWLKQLQLEQVASRQFQYSSLSDIQGWTGIRGDLFDTLMVFENYPVSKVIAEKEWSLQVEKVRVLEQTNYPLTIIVMGNGEQAHVQFSYNASLLDDFYVNQIRNHFEHVLLQLIDNKAASLQDIQAVTKVEKQQMLEAFNDNAKAYPADKTIISLFETKVLQSPDSTALLYEEEVISYRELNERSNSFAHYLIAKGVQREALVPVCIERGIHMLVAILGILKTGAAYVPIDPEYPAERISFMLADTGAPLLITSKACSLLIPVSETIQLIEVDTLWGEISGHPISNLDKTILPNNLAYVIYTSGSTGKPKGVLVEHKGMVNLAFSQSDALGLNSSFTLLQFASFGFDASCYEIFVTILNGGALVLPNKEALLSVPGFEQLVNRHKVDIATLPPSYLQVVKDNLGTLSTVFSVGEALNEPIASYIISKGIKLVNGYGPTENTVCVSLSFNPVRADKSVMIGKPTANVQVYILDKNQQPVTIGSVGEIYVAGSQLARGYLNQPALTTEKFVANPFSGVAGSLMYRTGDLGKWLPDGNLVYIGRVDDQVKIRGFRIELGEIESVLLQSGLVSQAVVLAKENSQGHQYLVAYLVPGDDKLDQAVVTAYLNSMLPEYMIPSALVQMDHFPITTNGKINKKALPDPGAAVLRNAEYIAPQGELEVKLAEIYEELLGTKNVGARDNFFGIGGHSLLAMRAIAAIKNAFEVELPVKTFFELVTIERVANFIRVSQADFSVEPDDYEEIKL